MYRDRKPEMARRTVFIYPFSFIFSTSLTLGGTWVAPAIQFPMSKVDLKTVMLPRKKEAE